MLYELLQVLCHKIDENSISIQLKVNPRSFVTYY